MRKMYFLCLAVLMAFLAYSPTAMSAVPVTDGLVLQLDTSDVNTTVRGGVTYVTSWTDQSGNNNDANQADETRQPTLVSNLTPAGGSAIKFDGDGDGDYLSIFPNSTLDGGTWTMFLVHSNGLFSGSGSRRMINLGYADINPDPLITQVSGVTYGITANTSTNGLRALGRNKTNGQIYAPTGNLSGGMVLDTFYIAAVSFDGVTTTSINASLINAAGDACSVSAGGLDAVGSGCTVAYIGCGAGMTNTTPANYFDGALCEVLVYNCILSPAEIASVNAYLTAKHLPSTAHDPTPANGSTISDSSTNLKWTPADGATSQTLYFSADQNSVVDAAPAALKATLAGDVNTYEVDSLQLSTKYYWKINQVVNGSTVSGTVWSFNVGSYYWVESFEKYVGTGSSTIPGSLRAAWADGYSLGAGNQLGSNVVLVNEVNNVSDTIYDGNTHSGAQSMLFAFDNTGNPITFAYPAGPVTYTPAYRYAEAKIDIGSLDIGTNWATAGDLNLNVYFSGKMTNDTSSPLYLALEDTTGHISTPIVYPTSSDIAVAGFHTWVICAGDLATNGVDMANLSKLRIGLGNRITPQVGGKGVIYIDDFRLYRQPKIAADINQDCKIDFKDFCLMAEDWLVHAGCVN